MAGSRQAILLCTLCVAGLLGQQLFITEVWNVTASVLCVEQLHTLCEYSDIDCVWRRALSVWVRLFETIHTHKLQRNSCMCVLLHATQHCILDQPKRVVNCQCCHWPPTWMLDYWSRGLHNQPVPTKHQVHRCLEVWYILTVLRQWQVSSISDALFSTLARPKWKVDDGMSRLCKTFYQELLDQATRVPHAVAMFRTSTKSWSRSESILDQITSTTENVCFHWEFQGVCSTTLVHHVLLIHRWQPSQQLQAG